MVENSILWEGVTIGSGATVKNSIIGKGVAIENSKQVVGLSL
jgi:ADP-glucose pyrophosphorylase